MKLSLKIKGFGCEFALCVEAGDGFEAGYLYPICGDNNGLHVLRWDERGEPHDLLCHQTGPWELFPAEGWSVPVFLLTEHGDRARAAADAEAAAEAMLKRDEGDGDD